MQRNYSFDYLRVIATIMVVLIHTSSPVISQFTPTTGWHITNIYEALSRASVPIFVMISGALFLSQSKEIKIKSFFLTRSLKVVIPLVTWSALYLLLKMLVINSIPVSLTNALQLFLTGNVHFHFWFLYMIIGLYLITPLVHVYVKHASKQNLTYFLGMWLVSSVLFKLINYMYQITIPIELSFVTGYVGYFILGYYLVKYPAKKLIKYSSIVFIISVGMTAGLTALFSNQTNAFYSFWYEYLSPNVVLSAVGLFLMFTRFTKPLPRIYKMINETSLGIYLLHPLVLSYLDNVFGLWIYNLHPVAGIPVQVGLTILICMIVVIVMQKIPFVELMVPGSSKKKHVSINKQQLQL
ncbi:hypothetical protein EJF36_01030 [Bacillus sp. HMF5848]|uniref:acyltransferase n=1 Tax=Bacillus sp. HMF5848 TaxID=2495421 RepID=UPI000F78C096|nr:acyltransferase family protein [Bacillus sp. HMF5848]RSK25604.1 hypothetical protein EJF36_01030 [Bacillus sp. HMF5848]